MKPREFVRGDVVHIVADLGRMMSHFRSDADAVVLYSYSSEYGGDSEHAKNSYGVMFCDIGSECAWYEGQQFEFLYHGGEAKIKEIEAAREARVLVESDLEWIVKNWSTFGDSVPGACFSTLGRLIGINNLWPSGEGYEYAMNASFIYKCFNDVLLTGDIEKVRTRATELMAVAKASKPTPP